MSKPVTASGTFSPEAAAARDRYFAYKKLHPEVVAYEDLTPLQKRMQAEGEAMCSALKADRHKREARSSK